MRAPGEVQAIFAGESHLDMIARELGMDPLEFRLKNVVRDDDDGALGDHFRENQARRALRAAAATAMRWKRPRPAKPGPRRSPCARCTSGRRGVRGTWSSAWVPTAGWS